MPATDLQSRFGANFKTFRKHANLTQQQVAILSGVAQTEISYIENGRINLTLRQMERLAKVVDHDVSNLLSASPVFPTKK